MSGVTAEISLQIAATLYGSNDLGTPKLKIDPISELIQFSAGTDAVGKCDLMFSDTRTLAASTNEDLDLAGVLADAFGATIAGAELVALFVRAADANTNNVQVARPATNGVPIFLAASDGRALLPGEFMLIVSRAGIAITAGTGDKVNIANSGAGTSVTYDILVLARSVAA